MARPRIKLTQREELLLQACAARGDSADVASKMIGGKISPETLRRRMREEGNTKQIQPPRKAKFATEVAPSEPGTLSEGEADPGAELPDVDDAATVQKWLEKCEKAANAAQAAGNLAGLATMARLVAVFMERKRKLTPPKVPNLNESPDMLALKERARARFHDLIEKTLAAQDGNG